MPTKKSSTAAKKGGSRLGSSSNRRRSDRARRAMGNDMFAPRDYADLIDGKFDPIDKPTRDDIDLTFNEFELSEITDIELTKYHQYATGMMSYAISFAAEARNKKMSAMTAMTRRKARLRLAYSDAKSAKWEIDDKVCLDDSVMEIQNILDEAAALTELAEAECSAWTYREKMLSRELTRRTHARENNL